MTDENTNTPPVDAAAPATPAADEATAQTLQDTPDPAMINEQVRAQIMANMAGQTIGQITQAALNLLSTATGNNPRLSLAVATELVLVFSEALRRGMEINEATPPASEPEAAPEAPTANG